MKQKLLFLIVMLAFLLPARLSAYDFESGGIYYDYSSWDDESQTYKEACVVSSPDNNKYSGDIVIPAEVEYEGHTYSVTSIGGYAFYECSSLTSIELPNSVTSIGYGAFCDCGDLASVVIGNSVTEIGKNAFYNCAIKSLTFNAENCESIGGTDGGLFYDSVETLIIGDSVTKIPSNFFYCCDKLTSLKLSNSVTSIGDYAFYNCSHLSSLEIPNSVTSIGDHAFYSSGLTSVEVGNSVTEIGDKAFYECQYLKFFIIFSPNVTFGENIIGGYHHEEVYVFAPQSLDCSSLNYDALFIINPENTSFLDDGTVLTDNGKTLVYVPVSVYRGTAYTIPEGVTKISTNAFCTSSHIESLTIPSSIEKIEPDVFRHIQADKVNFTDWSKWYSNVKLGNIYANPYWNSTPYVGGVQMVTPELQEGITEIPDYINYGLQFKDEIELPRSIKRIGAYAFYNNKELFSVILPAGLEEIGESAFEGCTLLENPAFPNGLK
ncbi:MAG: leucine-rich repeat domain-containing protein, partial [Muribaculaceae bacterium]|nr:leucine-rich repeat domain-containing protein [Muribaculaceae bacterium]